MMKKYKAILFDLDGTLLPMDTEKFLHAYGVAIHQHFQCFNDDKIFDKIMKSVNHVIESNEHKINEDKFFDVFKDLNSGDMSQYQQHFNDFYVEAFDATKAVVGRSEKMIEAIALLKEKGYPLIIATNPVFPMAANLKRISWAGLNSNDFKYISSLESNHYCKPNINFYKEVLELNQLNPEDVLMVGNDYEEDVVSSTIDVDNYIITDHMINRNILNIEPKYKGTYDEFYDFAKGNL